MLTRRRIIATGVGVAAGMAAAGCSSKKETPTEVSWSEPGTEATTSTPTPSAVRVTVTPAADTTKVSPKEKVLVSVEGGTLQTVTVTTGDKTVAGTLGDDRSWRSTGTLAYGKTYQVKASAADATGAVTEHTSSFSTVKPSSVATVSFQANALASLKTGGTYGVGQTVRVNFSTAVKDRAAAEKAMQVETTPKVEGRWRWVDGRNALWRPEKYWASGTKVSVSIDLVGTDLGNGVYGSAASTNFTIGPSRIAIADGKSHRMKCYIDGKMVRDMPVSLGMGGVVNGANYWTRSGPHVVLNKDDSYRMTSASYGVTDPKDPNFYDEVIKLCVRITYSGEFVHMADWNIPAQGFRNTSHGCINVGPGNARWFFDTFQVGDVVDVKNTPRQMVLSDGVGDWTIPWDKW
jgi:lipoprotein-anchoring transpeptidase ErfK/SrfK